MTIVFAPSWLEWDINKNQIAALKSQSNLSNKQQKNLAYLENNREKRRESEVFLSCFNEPDMRSAIQTASAKFKHDAEVNQLLLDGMGTAATITIDQGTHQAEDLAGGGFTLHFDARRGDGKCYHLYIGQEMTGKMKITSASYKGNAGFVHIAASA